MKRLAKALACGAVFVAISGCSGFVPSLSRGALVSPDYLLQFRGGGSLSTLWYLGSDSKYHYFAHYVKSSTNYRVRRGDLTIPIEFPYKTKEEVLVGDARFWDDLKNIKTIQQTPQTTGISGPRV